MAFSNIKKGQAVLNFAHTSVLLNETIDGLNIRPDGVYVDGTLGGAGHSYEIVRRLNAGGRLVGIDQDKDAIAAASERLKEYSDRVTIVKSNYCNMVKVLRELGIESADGILLDLGVSSYQLDTAQRGFSYSEDAPLDMRMDTDNPVTARDIVNGYPVQELYRMIRDYGEDKFAANIAKNIAAARQDGPIETTFQLNDIISASIPAKFRQNGHPSKRTFQAIRIELNRELEVLKDSLEDMIKILSPGGRICVITFHSLEDRIVKNIFKNCENPCICPPDFPKCVCGRKPLGRVITRKPVVPSQKEIEINKRAKSSKLRIFERISEG